jgi:hypothetical protein
MRVHFSRMWWIHICPLLLVAGAASSLPAQEKLEQRTIAVRVDPRVELVSLVFRLAGNPEYGKGQVKGYLKDVEQHFDSTRSHELIEYAAGLRAKYGVSFDACMSMAVHLNAEDGWALRFPLEPRPDGLDGRWQDQSAQEFATRLNQFAKDSRFDEFFTEHKELYEITEQRMETLLDEEVHAEWFDEFFGARPSAQFTVIPAILNGGNCYGPHVKDPDGNEEFYTILGVWQTDWSGRPRFDKSVVGTIVHEFCHSYTNAIVDRHAEAFRQAGEAMFPHVEDAMRRQAYGTWKTMIYESLVRASVVRYQQRFETPAAVLREIGRQNQRGFVWAEELSKLLGEYEENRDKYPTLDDFAPRLVDFFNDYAKEFDARHKKPPAPQVVSMLPKNGDDRVDPALTEIRVEFDQPMHDARWSMCGAGELFPQVVGDLSYDDDCKVWTAPVRLEPNHQYRFSLNSRWFHGFQNAAGVPLEPLEVRFTTGPSKDTN